MCELPAVDGMLSLLKQWRTFFDTREKFILFILFITLRKNLCLPFVAGEMALFVQRKNAAKMAALPNVFGQAVGEICRVC